MDNIFNTNFWQQFISNGLATFLGAILGVLSALWISKYQEKTARKKHVNKIIESINTELMINLEELEKWMQNSKNIQHADAGLLHANLRYETWKAFSDGGELEWIDNPLLVHYLADSYNNISSILYLSEKYFDMCYLGKTKIKQEFIEKHFTLLLRKVEEEIKEIHFLREVWLHTRKL